MKEYEIAVGYNIGELEKNVNDFILKGYKCQGGLSMIRNPDGSFFCTQAMVKNES